jgi:hypothetical protein
MSQIGLKALKVLGGAERPTENTAQLSEAWLKKIQKINQVADNMDTNNGVIKTKKNQPVKKQQQTKQFVAEETERKIPINEILARTKSDKIGLNKRQVSTDDIQALLSGNRGQAQPKAPTRNVETQYEQFIKESKEVTQSISTPRYEEPVNNDNRTILKEELGKIKRSIRGLVNEEVNSILFNEIFSEDRLKILIENVFRDVIEKRAKEILMETLKRKRSQSE